MKINIDNLSNGWELVKLNDIVNHRVTKGSTPTSYGFSYRDKGIKFIKIENIGPNGFIDEETDYIDEEANKFQKRSILEPQDILFSIAGTIGRVGIVQKKDAPANTNQALSIIRCDWNCINNKYLFYLLKSDIIQKQANNLTVGVGRANLSLTNIKNFDILLAPLPEQIRIVTKIEELFTQLDAGVSELQQAKSKLQRYRQAVLSAAVEGELTREWRETHQSELEPAEKLLARILAERRSKWEEAELSELRSKGKEPKDDQWKRKYKKPSTPNKEGHYELPEGWVWVNIGQVSFVKGGKRLLKGHTYAETYTKFPYIRVTDFENMTINPSGIRYLHPEAQHVISRYTISKDDVYISIAGSIGKIGVIPEYLDGANLTENAAKISNISGIDNRLLSYFLNSDFAQNQITQLIVSSNQPKLALFRIKSINVPVPPCNEQSIITQMVEHHLSVAYEIDSELNQSLNCAERLRQSILKRAFEGKLVVHLPEDGSARELLKQIKHQRELREKEAKQKKKTGQRKKSKPHAEQNNIDSAEDLYELLKTLPGDMVKTEHLWKESKIEINRFYFLLSEAIRESYIVEHREDFTVYLEASDEN